MKELCRYIDGRPDGCTMGQLKRFSLLHFGLVPKTFDRMLIDLKEAHVIEVRAGSLKFFLTQAGKRWLAEDVPFKITKQGGERDE